MIADKHRRVARLWRLPVLRALVGFCLATCGSGALRAEGPEVKQIQRAEIRVGVNGADLVGNDHRALQAAVDYVMMFRSILAPPSPRKQGKSILVRMCSMQFIDAARPGAIMRK
jgi:hypothetical protein